ncbi:hypothetical protein [Dyadobacter pollutisoli]|uniref:Uncharacterized protein n=1 Tax=Dyadobacter pollutisoli TaxID=2910158 RepID=A0A9E8N3Y5_9BACT|nr:hypothetical protein [Dyadobacter pollutisoli]WAC09260.1 hypothetical protein ON006_16020 [Dyadobacter pollutisoli]
MNKKLLLLLFAVLIIGYIVYDSATLPKAGDLKGNFKEVAVYRNKNNTGPITRIYAVSVEEPIMEEMKKYGDLMPYTKYGTTTVYFFNTTKQVPLELSGTEPHFDKSFDVGCIAIYKKNQNGEVSFGPNRDKSNFIEAHLYSARFSKLHNYESEPQDRRCGW